jgi:hypothetical protein
MLETNMTLSWQGSSESSPFAETVAPEDVVAVCD